MEDDSKYNRYYYDNTTRQRDACPKGISEQQIAEQLACFEKGFPYLKLYAAASVENGILALDADAQKNIWMRGKPI